MKLNPKTAFLALAMSVGVAGAAALPAGQSLTNQATADFQVTDPAALAVIYGTSASNQVSTVITAVPSFTITPNTNDNALTKNPVAANTTTTFTYTVTNTGNTPLNIDLTSANTSNTAPNNVLISVNGNTAAATNTITALAPGATATVTQTYTVGTPATYGQNLVGTGLYDSTPSATGAGDSYTETFTNNVDNDNANVAVVAPVTTAIPGSPVTGPTDFPADPSNPNITPNPDPTKTTTPGTGTGYIEPAGPTVPGGVTLPGAGTPVDVAPNGSQTAYPKADPDGNPDVVSMTGTAPNNSAVSDNITVGPAQVPAGSPTGTTATIINPKTGQPFVNGEVPVDINGNPITGATVTVNSDGSVTFNNVPPATAPAYTIEVTYPDASPNTTNPAINIAVPIYSGNAGGPAAGATAQIANPTYTVKQPGIDLVVVTQDSGTTLENSGQNIIPSTTGTVNVDFTTTVTNTGSYSDSYNLTNGTNDLPDGATVQYLLNGTPVTNTGVLAPGATATLTTRVILPANAPARTAYAVRVVATGAYSTITDTDGTLFNVGLVTTTPGGTDITDPNYTSNPLFPLNKTVDKTSAAPGDTVTYGITATNKYNAPACNVVLSELDGTNTNMFANSTYQSISGTSSAGTVLFSTSKSGSWGAAPAAGATAVYAGLDTNGDGAVTASDCLPIGGTINLTMTTQVNK